MSDVLPDEVLWAEGGHVSDIVLTAIADGQHGIVPMTARSHVERCTACMMHLGNAALLSIHTDAQLELRAAHDRELAKRPLPRLPIALGLLVAALGALPSILDGETLGSARAFVAKNVPVLVVALNKHSSDVFVTYATALFLVALGFALVRFLPKKEASR